MSRTLPGESVTCTTADCDVTGFKLFAAFAADWLGIGLLGVQSRSHQCRYIYSPATATTITS